MYLELCNLKGKYTRVELIVLKKPYQGEHVSIKEQITPTVSPWLAQFKIFTFCSLTNGWMD